MSAQTLTTEQVYKILVEHGVNVWKWIIPDNAWSTVSPDWVTANCAATIRHEPVQLLQRQQHGGGKTTQTFRWLKGCNDCENISLSCMVFGAKGHALSVLKNHRQPTGNLLGVCRMVIDANYATQTRMTEGGAHAPNWFIDHDLNLRLHEPQGNVHLTGITREVWQTATWGIAA